MTVDHIRRKRFGDLLFWGGGRKIEVRNGNESIISKNRMMVLELIQATSQHEEFLYHLYISTRIEEVTAWGWDDMTRNCFLNMQWNAQTRYYVNQYPAAEHFVVLFNGQPAGRILTCHEERDIVLIDISLLPEYRNQGIGGSLIKELQAAAESQGEPLRLSVLKTNPAIHLYERLGFLAISENELYYSMAWSKAPDTAGA